MIRAGPAQGCGDRLMRVGSIGLTSDFPVRIVAPKELDLATLRLGMSGVTTAFSDNAGPIGGLASILSGTRQAIINGRVLLRH